MKLRHCPSLMCMVGSVSGGSWSNSPGTWVIARLSDRRPCTKRRLEIEDVRDNSISFCSSDFLDINTDDPYHSYCYAIAARAHLAKQNGRERFVDVEKV